MENRRNCFCRRLRKTFFSRGATPETCFKFFKSKHNPAVCVYIKHGGSQKNFTNLNVIKRLERLIEKTVTSSTHRQLLK